MEAKVKCRAVLFDLDGTLVDTMRDYADLAARLLSERGLMSYDEARAAYLATSGRTFIDQLRMLGVGPRVAEEIYETFVEMKREIIGRAKIHEEALMLVEELKMKGCFVALSSNNECQLVEMLRGVERLDLVLCFDGSSHKKGRPHLETLRKRLGVEPEEAVFVGDSDYDLEVYAREGVRVLRTSGLFSSSERRRIAELVECSSSELNRT